MAKTKWNYLAEKQLIATLLFSVIFFATSLTIAQDKWSFEEKTDELTDKKIAYASHSPSRNTGAYIRCEQRTKRRGKFEVYFVFGEYLNKKLVPIRYRIDKGPLEEKKWWPSAKGTGVLVSTRSGAEVARQMIKGSKMIVEATDFRGQQHRIRLSLTGSSKAIEPVLQLCNISRIAFHEKIQGLRKEISLEMELWGPKNIRVNKKILSALGEYDGTIDDKIEPSFALAVQKFYDARVKVQSSLKKRIMPLVTMIIYRAAPEPLKKEKGKLYIGD